ncbi:hypothetical protein ABZ252_06510 [Streptomyces sp. NPDC006175]|uniref:hypothetical protein n=1 Tax=Streptomyces sp. NPDC006175 TaxID=3154471 RepID=UPI0033AEBA17
MRPLSQVVLATRDRAATPLDHAVCDGKETYFAAEVRSVRSPRTPEEKALASFLRESGVEDRFTAARASLGCD